MPWQEVTLKEQRFAFVQEALRGEKTLTALCQAYGISRKTGYKWLHRYQTQGESGLENRSRSPHRRPSRTPPDMEAQVLAVRREHPVWGGRKIAAYLARQGMERVPHPSTITAILRRHGLLGEPQPRKRVIHRFQADAPNDLWQMDFKAPMLLADGHKYPFLTILDDASRMLLYLRPCQEMTLAVVEQALITTFERYGLPKALLKDNGPPWGTADRQRYTRLEAWMLSYNIRPRRSRPYHPQTLGKDERLHRTLKAELASRLAESTLEEAVDLAEAWRQMYNEQRPHEALGNRVPAEIYSPSPRPWDGRPPTLVYPAEAQLRKVDPQGYLYFRGQRYRVGRGLAGRVLGLVLREGETDVWDLYLGQERLSRLAIRFPRRD